MKKIFTILALITVIVANAQTADEVVSKYLNAVGGKEKLNSITTLQFLQTMNFQTPMGPIEVKMTNIKAKGKLFRINAASEITGNAFTVITDTSGWILIPANPFSGSEATLQKMKPEEIKAAQSQFYAEGFFPELVNYAAKGYTAEILGEGKSSGKLSYKLKLKKDKDERIYMIDKQTGLVNALTVKGAAAAAMSGMSSMGMGGGKADKAELTLNFSDYKETDGVKIPGTLKIDTPIGTLEAKITDIKINKIIDVKMYRPE
jgi:hypothetical protein